MLHYAFHSVIFLSRIYLLVIFYYIDLSSATVWPMRQIKF